MQISFAIDGVDMEMHNSKSESKCNDWTNLFIYFFWSWELYRRYVHVL